MSTCAPPQAGGGVRGRRSSKARKVRVLQLRRDAMKTLRSIVLVLAAMIGSASALAGPLRYTFYDCGGDFDCSSPAPTVLTQFTTDGMIIAPPVPPPGTLTDRSAVDVLQQLEGAFEGLSMVSLNLNGAIGSIFVLDNLDAANGREFAPVMAFGAAVRSALHMNWGIGTYAGLAYVNCFNLRCSTQTTIRGYAQLVVDPWEPDTANTVPEPHGLALTLAALGLGGAALLRRPRGTAAAS